MSQQTQISNFKFQMLRSERRGAAIIIVLSFIVLLTGIVLAMLTLSLNNLKVSENSAEKIKVDLFARGAMDLILGDLKQEIVDGSTTMKDSSSNEILDENGRSVYMPKTAAEAMPKRVGSDNTLPNLVKRSARNLPFYTIGSGAGALNGPDRAAPLSTEEASLNGRSFKMERWNKTLLLPKEDPASDIDLKPVSEFKAPDWILVARDGSNPKTLTAANFAKGSNPVLGRFAYTIYDEGGLLDANVAGYPSSSTPLQASSKAGLAYADLGLIFEKAGFTPARADEIVDQIVAWRNYATLQPTGTFSSPSFASASGDSYYRYVLSNLKGFLSTANNSLFNNQSDRQFASRQELQKFLLTGVAQNAAERAKMQVALEYLATFTRGLDQPSYSHVPRDNVSTTNPRPKVLPPSQGGNSVGLFYSTAASQDVFNPRFLGVRVSGVFTRNDGVTSSTVGEPLVNKRFSLNRLAWFTHKGPSATLAPSDPVIEALVQRGISLSLLQQGTSEAIQRYFGLTWDSSNSQWLYDYHNGSGTSSAGSSGAIKKLSDITALGANGHEPDFFELLKAGIDVGSLAKSSKIAPTGDSTQIAQYNADIDVDAHVIQIGANIIDQFDVDGYPTRILFNNGTVTTPPTPLLPVVGVENLPYIYRVRNVYWKVRLSIPDTSGLHYGGPPAGGKFVAPSGTSSDPGTVTTAPGGGPPPQLTYPGVVYIMAIPDVWNPHDMNAPRGAKGTGGNSLYPTSFRVVAQSAPPGGIPQPFSISGGRDRINAALASDSNVSTSLPFPVYENYNADSSGWGNHARKVTTANSGLYFTVPDNLSGDGLFREPTILYKVGKPNGSNLSGTDPTGNGEDNAIISPKIANDDGNLNLFATGGGVAVDSGFSSGIEYNPNKEPRVGQSYLGIYFGAIPLACRVQNQPVGSNREWVTVRQVVGTTQHLSYMLQYLYDGKWVTYDTKYVPFTIGNLYNSTAQSGSSFPHFNSSSSEADHSYRFLDPRTARFGRLDVPGNWQEIPPWTGLGATGSWTLGATTGMLDADNVVVMSDRQDVESGRRFGNYSGDFFSNAGGFYLPSGNGWPGLLTQNRSDVFFGNKRHSAEGAALPSPLQSQYYTDADGILRRAMAGHVKATSASPAETQAALPHPQGGTLSGGTLTASSQSQSRPFILNRPFHSVAELGYTFSATPWKNVDFSSPESGYSALLDLFCLSETENVKGLVAGKVDLNTRQSLVLKAVLAGGNKDESKNLVPAPTYSPLNDLGESDAELVASALSQRTAIGGTTLSGTVSAPLTNIAGLTGEWKFSQPISNGTSPSVLAGAIAPHNIEGWKSYDGFSKDLDKVNFSSDLISMQKIPRFREAALRPLINSGQTRIWNLMIDLVAQTGVYPGPASNLANFRVEGEQRYWVHLAIDRVTGKVLDRQIEIVKE